MKMPVRDLPSLPCTAFEGMRRLARGPLAEVALAVRRAGDQRPTASILVFDDATGAVVDVDLRGSDEEIVARLAERTPPAARADQRPGGAETRAGGSRGRGRPKLGVVAREVTLLPRHWDWLARQPGGASGALRRLVDEARRRDAGQSEARTAREAAYRFVSAMAGDLAGFEEATRALFAGDRERFGRLAAGWPEDVAAHAAALAWREGGAGGGLREG